MAILIDMDMPMPDNCEDCGALGLYHVTMCKEARFTIFMHEAKRPEQCPLREVVRCKDCKHASNSLVPESVYCDEMERAVYIQGFCHHGERREE